MNLSPATLRLFFCALGVLLALAGTSCSTQTGYSGSAAGGGFYVSQVTAPTLRFAKRGLKDIKTKSSDILARFTGTGDGSYWNGDDMRGSPSMRISLGEQKVYFYKGGQLAGVSPISSGREGHDTRPGKFSVIEKDKKHRSTLYGQFLSKDGDVVVEEVDIRKDKAPPGTHFEGADMFHFMRITGAVGMHEGYLPGYAASHGCIRLPQNMAEIFYRESRVGTPVTIVP